MKKEQLVSNYKNNVIGKKSKIFFAILIDYFLIFIGCFALHVGVVTPISTTFPIYKESINGINTGKEELNKIVSSSHLQLFDEKTSRLENIEVTYNRYLTSLVKTSYYLNNEKYPTFDGTSYPLKEVNVEDTFDTPNYINDNVSFYFKKFKKDNPSLDFYIYENEDYSSKIDEYIYEKIMKLNELDYFVNSQDMNSFTFTADLNRYNVLKLDNAKLLMNKLIFNDTSSKANEIYTNIYNSYINAIDTGVEEIETKLDTYISTYNSFYHYYMSYVSFSIVSLLISYLLSYVIFEIILVYCFKKKNTIGNRALKLDFATIDEFEPSFKNRFIYNLVIFFTYFSNLFLVSIFTSQYASLLISSSGFSLLGFIVFSFALDLISLILLIVKKNNQSLSLFASNMVLKSKEDFENIPIKDEDNGKN